MPIENSGQGRNKMEQKIRCLSISDACFPERLKQIPRPPKQLYLRGELPDFSKKTVAIIGAREASSYGRQMAFEFARVLAGQDVQIISGLARGIDAAGHEGALSVGKKTYAVLGCGADVCYPAQNKSLYNNIIANGGIISEYPPGAEPLAWHFPVRNRIISGLADLVLVIEARIKSGAMITADAALEQGKDVYAMPGRVTDRLSEGCHRLIAQGAGIAWNADEVMFALFHGERQKNECVSSYKNGTCNTMNDKREEQISARKIISGLAREEKKVYSCISLHPKHINELLKETGLDMQNLLSALLSLELNGYIKENTKNYYVVNNT